jgi:hypothetical protein
MKLVSRILVCAALLLATLAFIPAQAQSNNVIYACVGDLAQFARIVNAPTACTRGEKIVEWNIVGIAGPAGPQGPGGLPGPIGPSGPSGAAGPAGAAGSIGPQGLAGAKGDAGATGPAGAAGPSGAAGSIGPQGPTGQAGPKGDTGSAGAAGPAGAAGSIGPQGPAGQAGPKGDTGSAGATGQAGPQGPTGPTGATGPQGPQGTPGSSTLPANLQAFSTLLTPIESQEYNAQFTSGNGGTCTLGDIVLSTDRYYGGNYQPADGTLYQISTNTAVFSLLGTRFGGDGVHTFGVPNLNAATPSGLYYSICFKGVFPPRL